MSSFNKVVLMGNITRDPDLTYTPSQMAICKFGIAMNRKFKAKDGGTREEVCFVDVNAFDKKAEQIHKFFSKGKPILIDGSLRLDTWDDRATGQKRSKLYVVAENFQFCGGNDKPSQSGDSNGEPSPSPAESNDLDIPGL